MITNESIYPITSKITTTRSDFARYLCVLVSGYLETSVTELLLEHA